MSNPAHGDTAARRFCLLPVLSFVPDLPSFLHSLPSPWGAPVARACLKVRPEDFRVEECLHVQPCGEGEHLWLRVRKRGLNTDQVARLLARAAGIPGRQVAHAGLKDRQAVTEQWFSLHLPGRRDLDESLAALSDPAFQVLRAVRHERRLRPGALAGNRFRIRLRAIEGDPDAVAQRLARVAAQGFPNYFGPQRFGRDAANWHQGLRLLRGAARRLDRHHRGLCLSALRSHLFNRVLAARVEAGVWNACLAGDLMQLDGRNACFTAERCDREIRAQLEQGEIHPTGPLPGRPRRQPAGEAARLENRILEPFAEVVEGLAALRVDSDRRALRARVREFRILDSGPGTLEVAFRLPPGSYATVFLAQAVEAKSSAEFRTGG